MATYSMFATTVSLLVQDIPLWYHPPVGPAVDFHVYHNQGDLNQLPTLPYWNFGPKWTNDWLSYVTDDPANPGQNVSIYLQGGGIDRYEGFHRHGIPLDTHLGMIP
jgi:hypothetical protein